MSHHNMALHTLLVQLATTVRDLCQRQIDKSRSLDNINLDAVVDRLLREQDHALDSDRQPDSRINAMLQDDAVDLRL
jgi:23S rRNA G2445 N2-methylase RlmL